VGHTGTLDPFASGLLPVLAGRATRLGTFLVGLPKTYTGVLRLGRTTDTDDATGTAVRDDPAWEAVTDAGLAAAMGALTGRLQQIPPAYSAKKVQGVRAYRHARRGQAVTLQPRAVEVRTFVASHRAGPDITFTADVSSGTYVRALARDLGEHLGCGAHLVALRRTGVGRWSVSQAVTVEQIAAGFSLRPPAEAVMHLPRRSLDETEARLVRHGRPVPAADAPDGPVGLFTGSELLGVGVRHGELLLPRVVLAE
jgi:tRNA pseudouridine55 synthase